MRIHTACCTAAFALALALFSQSVSADDGLASKALALLSIALQCHGPLSIKTEVTPDPSLVTYAYRGDKDVFMALEAINQYTILTPTGDDRRASIRQERKSLVSFEFSQMSLPEVQGPYVYLRCVGAKVCVNSFAVSYYQIVANRDGTQNALNAVPSDASSTYTFKVCRAEAANLALALKTLITESRSRTAGVPTYVVDVPADAPWNALKIFAAPDDEKEILVLSKDSGPLVLGDCTTTATGKWCKIHWGAVDGWVDMSLMRPAG